MIIVLFEVTVKKECMDKYLTLAANLKNALIKSEGFIRSERFSSLVNERKLLSLSVWESEEAIAEWRSQEEHRMGQQQGRDSIFEDYTITVASQICSYGKTERSEAPEDSNKFFNTTKPNINKMVAVKTSQNSKRRTNIRSVAETGKGRYSGAYASAALLWQRLTGCLRQETV